jgi:hypothetical protein
MALDIEFNNARQRVLAGEPLSIDEQRRLCEVIRNGRYSAGEASATSRTKKTATAESCKRRHG